MTGAVPTSERDVGDGDAALEAVTVYADDWSLGLTDDQVACVEGNLGEESRSGGGSLDEVDIPFFLLGCTCATDALVAGFGAEGFVDVLGSTDGPTPADDATAVAAFDSCGLDGTAIVGG